MIDISKEAALEQCAEECVELAKAALKLARIYRGENPTPVTEKDAKANLNEEAADVYLCLDTLSEMDVFNKASIIDIKSEKKRRWIHRLTERRKQNGTEESK